MKAAIYNPYWNTLGGGERYTITFARILSESGYAVDIEWRDPTLLAKIKGRFGIGFENVRIVENIKKGDGYDVCFWVSDGSIPLLNSRRNFIHFQVPFQNVNGSSLLNRMKLFRVNKVICNSKYTKSFIDKEFSVESIVIYPPCEVDKIIPKRKENIILSVGRFSQLLQSKHQDILVRAFRKLEKNRFGDWRLILAGGSDVGGSEFVGKLRKMASGANIEVIENPSFSQIVELYGKAKIYWSASGFGERADKDPKKLEHFGIAIVESMAGGAIPLAYNGGGHLEVVGNDRWLLWDDIGELIRKTEDLVKNSEFRSISKSMVERSKLFGYEKFKSSVLALL